MAEELIDILEAYTPLTKDNDLFYLEMPLNTAGLWFSERSSDNARTGYQDFDVYYRGKNKSIGIQNISLLKDTIDNLEECSVNNTIFKLTFESSWEFLEKDSESYFVWASTVRLI